MSLEQLLFFLILVALPLLERLIRAGSARAGTPPSEREPAAAGRTVSGPRPALSSPDSGTASWDRPTELRAPTSAVPPVVPQVVRHTASETLPVTERELRVPAGRQHRPPAKQRQGRPEERMRPLPALAGGVPGGDLGRAIVLMAILGPCRALEPKDAAQLN